MERFIEILKGLGDIVSLSAVIAALVEAIPHLAALGSLLWIWIRVVETQTVQNYLKNRRKRRGSHSRRKK